MSFFDLVEIANFSDTPEWINKATLGEIAIFKVAKSRFEELAEKLQSRQPLPIRQRQLVRTQLSKAAGLNDKYIHKDKTPDLYMWIETANKVLAEMANQQNCSANHLKQTIKMKRDSLLEYIKELETESEQFKKISITTLCRQLIDSELVSTHAEMSVTLERLKNDLRASHERETNAEERAQKWRASHIELQEKYEKLQNELSNLQKPNLRISSNQSE